MQSMTGYGRGAAHGDGREISVELKTVNHRFLDISFRMPRNLTFLEDVIRERLLRGGIGRGHVDVFVNYTNRREDAREIAVNQAALLGFNRAVKGAAKLLEPFRRASVAEALSLSGALTVAQAEEDAEAVTELALLAADKAVAALTAMRDREGRALAEDLLQNLEALSGLRDQIALRAPLVPEEYRRRLIARLEEWRVGEVDPQRVAQEVAIMADRCAIDEELSRLGSHISQFRLTVEGEGEAGKKLDFLLQEMNREVNTIGSKASDAELAQAVVDGKCIVEKLREQVQNAV